MSRYTHTIKLIPLDLFHFSDDNKFRSKIKKTPDGKFKRSLVQEYIQRSRNFPQQTSIVGALRYLLLALNDQIPITDDELAKKLIGYRSWNIDEKCELGKIKSISPVFLYDGDTGEDYHLNSKHYYLSGPYVSHAHRLIDSPFKSTHGQTKIWANYDDKFFENEVKKDFLHRLGDASDCIYMDQEPLKADHNVSTDDIKNLDYGVFIRSEKVGIDKVKNIEDNPEALFKMHQFKLNASCYFKLYANLDIDESVHSFIPIGTDGHVFIVEIEKKASRFPFDQITPGKHIVSLLSDTFLNTTQYKWVKNKAQFFACESVPFRYMKSKVTKGNEYYTKNPSTGEDDDFKLAKNKLNLLSAGSVFYFDNDEDVISFTEEIKKHENMRMIGYNMYWNHN